MKNSKIEIDIYLIAMLCVIGMAVALACNLVYFFWYKIDLFGYTLIFSLAGFFYPLTFAVVDLIAYLKKGFFPIFIAVIMRLGDGIFSNIPMLTGIAKEHSYIPHDSLSRLPDAVITLAPNLSSLWCNGVLASTATVIIEIIIFRKLLKHLNNAPIAIIVATSITILVHNMLLDYSMLKTYDNHWNIIIGNYFMNVLMVCIYASLVAVIIKVRKKIN
ncbi:hypothetical protein QIW49_06305 [Francisellaceae bacterium CB300]|jgi:hypothetical protein